MFFFNGLLWGTFPSAGKRALALTCGKRVNALVGARGRFRALAQGTIRAVALTWAVAVRVLHEPPHVRAEPADGRAALVVDGVGAQPDPLPDQVPLLEQLFDAAANGGAAVGALVHQLLHRERVVRVVGGDRGEDALG